MYDIQMQSSRSVSKRAADDVASIVAELQSIVSKLEEIGINEFAPLSRS